MVGLIVLRPSLSQLPRCKNISQDCLVKSATRMLFLKKSQRSSQGSKASRTTFLIWGVRIYLNYFYFSWKIWKDLAVMYPLFLSGNIFLEWKCSQLTLVSADLLHSFLPYTYKILIHWCKSVLLFGLKISSISITWDLQKCRISGLFRTCFKVSILIKALDDFIVH